jgi:transposase
LGESSIGQSRPIPTGEEDQDQTVGREYPKRRVGKKGVGKKGVRNLFLLVVLPKRWVVGRTFGWLMRYRRHSRDYERNPKSSETMVYIAMINVMSRRLAAGKGV